MKLEEAISKRTYRDRTLVNGRHCDGEAGFVRYKIFLHDDVVKRDPYVASAGGLLGDEFLDDLYDWLESFGAVRTFDATMKLEWDPSTPQKWFAITVPATVSLDEAVEQIDLLLARWL